MLIDQIVKKLQKRKFKRISIKPTNYQTPLVLRSSNYRPAKNMVLSPNIFQEVISTWDVRFPGWRCFRAHEGNWIDRPLYLAMYFDSQVVRSWNVAQRRTFCLFDSLSHEVESFRKQGSVKFVVIGENEPLIDQQVDRYLHKGGMIITTPDVGYNDFKFAKFDLPKTTQLSNNLWDTGDPTELKMRMRCAKFALLQYGQLLYAEGDNYHSRKMLEEIEGYWSPFFAWHIDIWAQLAAGLDRFRYSSPEFPNLAFTAVESGCNLLESRGISSRQLLCSDA
jgi:hypothetical protein